MPMKVSAEMPEPASRPAANVAPQWHGLPTAIARRFHQICVAKTSEVVGKAGLTPLQYGVLVHLSKLTGKPGIDQNSLADRLNVDRNTASLLVEELVKTGLVERQVNGADRLYGQLRPVHLAANESILAPISPGEGKLLIGLLIRVVEGNLAQETRVLSGRKRRLRQ